MHGTRERFAFRSFACAAVVLTLAAGATAATKHRGQAQCATVDKVRVAYVGGTIAAHFALAGDRGYFSEQCLDVSLVRAVSSPAAAALLTSGDVQFAGPMNAPQWIAAVAEGLDIKSLGASSYANRDVVIVVKRDGPIRSVADLKGKTIALGNLNNLAHAGLIVALARAGLNPKNDVRLIQVPGASAPQQVLLAGTVDAAQVSEPFLTEFSSQTRVLIDPYTPFGRATPIGVNLVTGAYARSNPSITARFQEAIFKAQHHASNNPVSVQAAVHSLVPTLSDEVLARMRLPGWGVNPKFGSIDAQIKRVVKLGFLTRLPAQLNIRSLFLRPDLSKLRNPGYLVLPGWDRYDKIVGTSGADIIFGFEGRDNLDGRGGHDIIDGGVARDTINGGAGRDVIVSRDGVSDQVDCGAGFDTVYRDKLDKVKNCERQLYTVPPARFVGK